MKRRKKMFATAKENFCTLRLEEITHANKMLHSTQRGKPSSEIAIEVFYPAPKFEYNFMLQLSSRNTPETTVQLFFTIKITPITLQ